MYTRIPDLDEVPGECDPLEWDALLDDSEGEHRLCCGCLMTRSFNDHGVYFVACAMHRAAAEVTDALSLLLGVLNRDRDGDYFICQEAEARVDAVWAALKKTTGETP